MLRCNTSAYKRLQELLPCKCNYITHATKQRTRLYSGFSSDCTPLKCPRYQTYTIGHNTTRATLEGIHASGRAPPVPDTTATPRHCADQHRPSIIIRYIRGCRGAPCYGSMPAAAGQRLHPSIWQGSTRRGLNAFHARRLEILHRVSGQGGRSGALHPAGQSSGRSNGGRRGTIGGYRRISFRAVAR